MCVLFGLFPITLFSCNTPWFSLSVCVCVYIHGVINLYSFQLLRKRHIGNDIVTVIFQEPNCSPFSPKVIRSHFQHIFIIVQVENPGTDYTKYKYVQLKRGQIKFYPPQFFFLPPPPHTVPLIEFLCQGVKIYHTLDLPFQRAEFSTGTNNLKNFF